MSDVPWDVFVSFPDGDSKFSDSWLSNPANVVSTFRDDSHHCRLCDRSFTERPADHVAGHEPELRDWRAGQRTNGRLTDAELGARLAKAVALVERGVSQRKAASVSGVSRIRLQRALQSQRGAEQRVAHAGTGVVGPCRE